MRTTLRTIFHTLLFRAMRTQHIHHVQRPTALRSVFQQVSVTKSRQLVVIHPSRSITAVQVIHRVKLRKPLKRHTLCLLHHLIGQRQR